MNFETWQHELEQGRHNLFNTEPLLSMLDRAGAQGRAGAGLPSWLQKLRTSLSPVSLSGEHVPISSGCWED